ncbi:MAG: hypothetical protein ACYTGR_18075 [Planctomycetota bacterium]|jgi:hypothetical protein
MPTRLTPPLAGNAPIRVILLLVAFISVGGCSQNVGGQLTTRSLTDSPVALQAWYTTAVYGHTDSRGTTFIVSDRPTSELLDGSIRDGQVVHLHLLWRPKAGSTPMDSTATNVSIRQVVFSDGQIGVYGGAGFATVQGTPGEDLMTLTVKEASLELLDSTPGFVDPLSPARLTGKVTAEQDLLRTRRLYFNVSQVVTDALGRSRFVFAGPEPGTS